jgi:SAM-dependent methyltransferase
MKSNYDVIAQFYDTVVEDPTKKVLWLKQLIDKHHPAAKGILELACGTGSILAVLAEDYHVVGLDNSAEMLKAARKKLPEVEFIQADMSDFTVKQKFDVVLCIYDSINHLMSFSEWQSMFRKVAEHLKSDGLFIFDMNTVEFLNKLNTSEGSISSYGDNTMTIHAVPNDKAITTLKVEVVERQSDGKTITHKTDIPENSFDLLEVEAALKERFEVLSRLGEKQDTEWKNEDNKVVYICRLA